MSTDIDSNFNAEQYLLKLLEAKRKLKEVFEKNFQDRFWILEICLSVRAILEIEGITLPFMLVLLGPPSAGKSLILEIIASLPDAHSLDSFTPKAFVTQMAGRSEEQLAAIDLLKQIENKVFLTSDLAPLFSTNDEELGQIIGILTRVLDGRGYTNSSGAHGKRGYDRIFFVWIGATVEVSKKMWSVMASAGPKTYFLRINVETAYEEELEEVIGNMEGTEHDLKIDEVKEAVQNYWDVVISFPTKRNGKVVWDKARDIQSGLYKTIVKYAQFLAHLRAHVPTDRTEGTGGSNYGFMTPTIENPNRAAHVLYNLAKGHALCEGRNYITEEDIFVIKRVVLSSAPKTIVDLIKRLIELNGEATSAQLEEKIGSKSTTLKTMKKVEMMGLVDEVMVSGTTKDFKAIRLKDQFRWLLGEEKKE
jgi:hypothetical protein